MNGINSNCPECGKAMYGEVNGVRWECKCGDRVCCICNSWHHKKRMIQDASLQLPHNVGSDFHGWICADCAAVTGNDAK